MAGWAGTGRGMLRPSVLASFARCSVQPPGADPMSIAANASGKPWTWREAPHHDACHSTPVHAILSAVRTANKCHAPPNPLHPSHQHVPMFTWCHDLNTE